MILPGLVSVTFRALPPEQVAALVQRAGLAALEWGGDIHVPHGDLPAARRVRALTADCGLRTAAYGSYYRAGHGEPCPFETVLETALELGAPLIRIWAGKLGSAEASPQQRARVAEDSQRCAELAARAGLRVAFEFHGGTLTDTPESARALLEQAAHPALGCGWQPPKGAARAEALAGLAAVRPWLAHLHVFHWQLAGSPPEVQRLPLAEGEADWRAYLAAAAQDGRERCALLEFVRGDDPDQFLRDAAALRAMLAEANTSL